ncbi:hypothetical protein GTA09_20205 [Rhodococcus hoagii]|nr:hypothetical protein [Prescottella equi]
MNGSFFGRVESYCLAAAPFRGSKLVTVSMSFALTAHLRYVGWSWAWGVRRCGRGGCGFGRAFGGVAGLLGVERELDVRIVGGGRCSGGVGHGRRRLGRNSRYPKASSWRCSV